MSYEEEKRLIFWALRYTPIAKLAQITHKRSIINNQERLSSAAYFIAVMKLAHELRHAKEARSMTPDQLGVLILAGGRSVRFGDSDKLLADVNGMPLGLHTAERLADLPWASRTAVTSGSLGAPLSKLGYQVVPAVENGGMGDNLASGVRSLPAVEAVLILLADMPFVSVGHINRLVAAATSSACIVASTNDGELTPPVIFGKRHFEDLIRLSGDAGARKIINDRRLQAILIEAAPEELVDIDTKEALASAIAKFKY